MARSNKPILWLPFAAGGLVAALVIPVLILLTGLLLPFAAPARGKPAGLFLERLGRGTATRPARA